jgi:hypothetical protein
MATTATNSVAFNRSALEMLDTTERELYVAAVVRYLDCEMNDQGLAEAYRELAALNDMMLSDGWEPWVLEIVDAAVFALHS